MGQYRYIVDYFNYDACSVPHLYDVSLDDYRLMPAQITLDQEHGFYRMILESDNPILSLVLQNGEKDVACGVFRNGSFLLTPTYSHVYLIGSDQRPTTSSTINPINPPITCYRSWLANGKIQLSALVSYPAQEVVVYYQNPLTKTKLTARRSNTYALAEEHPLVPVECSEKGLYLVTVDIEMMIPPQAEVWFKMRLKLREGDERATTLFGVHNDDEVPYSLLHASCLMPDYGLSVIPDYTPWQGRLKGECTYTFDIEHTFNEISIFLQMQYMGNIELYLNGYDVLASSSDVRYGSVDMIHDTYELSRMINLPTNVISAGRNTIRVRATTEIDQQSFFLMKCFRLLLYRYIPEPYTIMNITMSPGKTTDERGFAWSSNAPHAGGLTYWKEGGKAIVAVAEATPMSELVRFYTNKVTIRYLQPNSKYVYYISHGDDTTETYTFYTDSMTDIFSFLAITDVQLGKNSMIEPVAMAFYRTLEHVEKAWSDELSFILNSGDQIEHPESEYQYTLYFAPKIMRSIPVVTTVGSHDNHQIYLEHFPLPDTLCLIGQAPTGGNYWFVYGETLFLCLDTNDRDEADVQNHRIFMMDAIETYKKEHHGREPRWKILNFHYLPYAGTDYAVAQELRNLRAWLTPLIVELDIDVSFNGHQHAYTRTLMMGGEGNANGGTRELGTAGSKAITTGYIAKPNNPYAEYTKNKGESFYHTGNSASLGFNPLRKESYDYEYIAKAEQSYRPTVTWVEITHASITLKAYYSDEEIDKETYFDSFVLRKEK